MLLVLLHLVRELLIYLLLLVLVLHHLLTLSSDLLLLVVGLLEDLGSDEDLHRLYYLWSLLGSHEVLGDGFELD